ncbi:MAG: hypothetical protein ACLQMS_13615 [Desulfomonilaceae bacterium]
MIAIRRATTGLCSGTMNKVITRTYTALSVQKRSAVFCLVDRKNRVRSLTGNLDIYGLGDIKEGRCVEDRLPFLRWLLAEDRGIMPKRNILKNPELPG